jgi:hypothetical protein
MMQVDPDSLLKLFELHLSWYPLMEPCDIYKLIYQGVMGSEHIISSPEKFKSDILLELDDLSAAPAERLLEPVCTDMTLLRLNLRSWKARHIELDQLNMALLETGEKYTSNQALLQSYWERFVQLCEIGRIRQFSTKKVNGFGSWLEEMAFPVIHHSDIYRQAYQPAYRLLSARFVPALGLTDAS